MPLFIYRVKCAYAWRIWNPVEFKNECLRCLSPFESSQTIKLNENSKEKKK